MPTEEVIVAPVAAKPKRKWLRRLLLSILVVPLVIVALAVLSAWLLEDKIKAQIIASINEQVTVPVQVKGKIELSLLSHFPDASLTFYDVRIADSLRSGKELLRLKEVSFLANIYSLFSDKIEFTKIELKDGALNLFINSKDRKNFDILKETKSDGKSASIQLKKATLRNVRLSFLDKKRGADLLLQVNRVSLRGDFSDALFEMDADLQLAIKRMKFGEQEFLEGRNVKAELSMKVDKGAKKTSITRAKVTVDESAFAASGFLKLLDSGTYMDFRAANEGEDMQQLLSLLPPQYKQNLADANGSGKYAIAATVKGTVSNSSLPEVKVQADLSNSNIQLGRFSKELTKVFAKVNYELDAQGVDHLHIANFTSELNGRPFNFDLKLAHLREPDFDFSANGILELSELQAFIPDSVMKELSGRIHFINFHLKGSQRDFTSPQNSGMVGSGEFKLEEVEFQQNGITYGNINGLLKYDEQTIHAENFSLNFLGTDFLFTGYARNLLAFVYALGEERKANGIVLEANGKVSINTFNLTDMIAAFDKKNRAGSPDASGRPTRQKVNVREVMNMKGNIDISVGRFLYQQMRFDELRGNITMSPGILQINSLQARAMEGDVKCFGRMLFTDANEFKLVVDISAVGMDIPTIFRQCSNFQQQTLTDKNLNGRLSTSLSINATWKNYKELDMPSLNALLDFEITDGELVNFEPIKAASKFIRVEELQRIRFSKLSNFIRIANEKIEVPEMEIKSSALNLMLSGTHRFDNLVDYHFKINLKKLLAQKFRTRSTDLQYMEEDPYEGVNIFLSMTGPLANPKFKYDKAALGKKMLHDIAAQRDELRRLWNNEKQVHDAEEMKREERYFNTDVVPEVLEFDTTGD